MRADRVVFWSVTAITIGVWVAVGFGYLGSGMAPIVIAIIVTLAAAFIGAWNFDRRGVRRLGGHYDVNKANFFAPMNNQTWQIPTAYIDHPSGGGPPPGEQLDREDLGEMSGDRPVFADRDDPAP